MSARTIARRTGRLFRVLAVAGATVVAVLHPPAATASSSPCLRPPVVAPIADPYRAPACRWCPGNRGIDYATPAGTVVHAAAAGAVTFAGPVAGSRWVTVAHAGGVLTTYGPLGEIGVVRGERVSAGEPIGLAAGRLHFGVRIEGAYVDPALLLGAASHLVPRLVRLDGRIPPPPVLRCPASGVDPVGGAEGPPSPADRLGPSIWRIGLGPVAALAALSIPSASLPAHSGSVSESITTRPILPAVARR